MVGKRESDKSMDELFAEFKLLRHRADRTRRKTIEFTQQIETRGGPITSSFLVETTGCPDSVGEDEDSVLSDT